MKLKLPAIFSIVFISLISANNEWAKFRTYSYYHNGENLAKPIREELKKDDFLNDEAETETLVINLWATWCGPCQKEIPKLNKLVEKYENENTLFLAITDEKEDEVLAWVDLQKNEPEYFLLNENKRLMNYIFTLNPNKKLKKGRAPERLPTNIIIHNSEVIYFKQGFLEKNIEKMDSVLNKIQNY